MSASEPTRPTPSSAPRSGHCSAHCSGHCSAHCSGHCSAHCSDGPRIPTKRGHRRAQAITEYSLVVFAVMGLGLIGGWNLIPAFIDSFQKYFDGFYILLNLPIP
jgi:hypothetical protein